MQDAPVYRRRDLPHIDQGGSIYFITWRLRTGLPDLTEAERELVRDALLHFSGERYKLVAWVVMNDHVHVLFQPVGEFTRSSILHSWKSFTANQMQRLFGRGGVGSIWQSESHDHLIRNEADMYEKWQYILDNPQKRWPQQAGYRWVSQAEDADLTAGSRR